METLRNKLKIIRISIYQGVRRCIYGILWMLPPRVAHSIIYYFGHKSKMDWKNPTTYDEKIHWLIVNRLTSEHATYADKYLVRNYIEKCGYGDLLVPMQGVWEQPEDIDFAGLEYPCIFKTNNGSGSICYCRMSKDSEEERMKVLSKMKKALRLPIEKKNCEYHYQFINPLIICEKLLCDMDEQLTDYKLVCSKGEIFSILVCQNRNQGRDYYTLDWKHTEYTKKSKQSGYLVPPPKGLDKMIEAARILSKPFELARIDFYDIEGKVYVGEITMTPSAGTHKNLSSAGQREIGAFIKL